jgi:hypothetical protein
VGHKKRHNYPALIWRLAAVSNACLSNYIVTRIRSYAQSSPSDTVNTFRFWDNNKLHLFSSTELLKHLCFTATSIGADSLDFSAKQIGLCSARSGAAMAMYLARVPVFTIMLLGRWSSDAFLHYIHKQVKEFGNGISSKMIQLEHFFTIPSSSAEDPRISNHPLNHACSDSYGCNFKDTVRPLASVFHKLLSL